ncbi:MAG: glycoside hydrolase family 88 protein [Treponema sp.]|jgi:rhamnogalacturonyl hydrolase YesR|nr:glycoside hydrolase family 88 protein [Treponema sp.]
MLPNVLEAGKKAACRFLETPHLFYNNTIHYAETFTWYGALQYAELTGDKSLFSSLRKKFDLLCSEERQYLPAKNHVDFNMFGCLPLEFYRLTGEERYRALGMPYADTQWDPVPSAGGGDNAADLTEEQREWLRRGYSWQTRLWMDDMYMIAIVQSHAFKVTGDRKYLDRTAREMVLYLDRLQRPDGLFYHAPDAPFLWGRANGWMAAGMAELLKILPRDNPDFSRIMQSYRLMAESLGNHQGPEGLWKQLIDEPGFWNETSCTAMFTFALLTGLKRGWIPAGVYRPVVERAWKGLYSCIEDTGDLREVCAGTPKSGSKQFYYDRPRITGDYHGQAPLLWCVNEGLSLDNAVCPQSNRLCGQTLNNVEKGNIQH